MVIEIHSEISRNNSLYQQWCELACTPLEHPDWLLTWWDAYGRDARDSQLHVVTIRENEKLVALSPLFVKGSRLRLLGSGAVSTDHQELLIGTESIETTRQFLLWLLDQTNLSGWTNTELECIDENSTTLSAVRQISATREGLVLLSNDTANCKLELPTDWESYLGSLSRNHRKRCRRWERNYFESGRVWTKSTHQEWDYDDAFSCLVELHGRRRLDANESPKLFECHRFSVFLRNAFRSLASKGMAEISAIVLDDQVVAIEFEMSSKNTVFAYQSGMIAGSQKISPGSLSIMSRIRSAIEGGKQTYDFMRGAEDYKFRWGATVQPTSSVKLWRTSTKGRIALSSHRLYQQSKSFVRELIHS